MVELDFDNLTEKLGMTRQAKVSRWHLWSLTRILRQMERQIQDDAEMDWNDFSTPYELREETKQSAQELRSDPVAGIFRVIFLFMPTGGFHEYAVANGGMFTYIWKTLYLALILLTMRWPYALFKKVNRDNELSHVVIEFMIKDVKPTLAAVQKQIEMENG
jgi:hypothetical protein